MPRGGARPGAGRKKKIVDPSGAPIPQPPKRGKPSSFQEEFCDQAEKLCRLGATDLDVADFFGVDVRTIYRWRLAHDSFRQSLNRGKDVADNAVEQSLLRRALGYSHDAVDIKAYRGQVIKTPYIEHHPPDTTACIFWLKNRRPNEWRDKQEFEHSGAIGQRTDDEIRRELEEIGRRERIDAEAGALASAVPNKSNGMVH